MCDLKRNPCGSQDLGGALGSEYELSGDPDCERCNRWPQALTGLATGECTIDGLMQILEIEGLLKQPRHTASIRLLEQIAGGKPVMRIVLRWG